ncbi:hypothetical protein GIB67_030855 [Kingdonia uniflora]|uniref:FAD-binding FR-type domain-containing protein n=1 Tax=Kingdonia uniflora TaxID=39325 RepID=A0A7J7L388_9MAGN|nr:hypothetical protein GIB67_030855 [Kingdonia uniflora]
MATESSLRIVLKGLMILICVVWVCLWVFKPTELWTKIWHKAEDNARNTVLGYYGLDFVVYSFPIIALAIVGFIYLHLSAKESRNRDIRMSSINFSNPVIVRGSLGIISGFELLVAAIFTMILVWTIYAHISNDFKKKKPVKSLKLNDWQFKFSRFGTRFGLLAEVCLALLLLPVLRGMALFRLIGIQFEASVRYHVFLGTCMIFFATLHGSATFFIWGIKQQLQTEIWKWQKTGRVYLAGEIALISGLVIWVTSLPQIRRKRFEIFYYTHHLYTVFIVFFLFHAGDRHFYMVFSGVFLFALDKLLRVMQSRPIACVVSARILPCKAIELTLAKDPNLKYTPTSVIFLKVPSISKLQWHPFSITSSSSADDERLSIIVKGDGGWTNTLYSTILDGMDSEARHLKCLPVSFEGPYGPVSMDFLRYDSLLLVAGGIGITPFLSILQELYFPRNSNKSKLPTRIQLIYAVKKSQDISLLNSVSSLLLDHSLCQPHLKVNIFVTQEGKSGLTFRELLSDSSQIETINFDTGCSNYTNLGLHFSNPSPVVLRLSGIDYTETEVGPGNSSTLEYPMQMLIIFLFLLSGYPSQDRLLMGKATPAHLSGFGVWT